MAKHGKYRIPVIKNGQEEYEVVHLETDAGMVVDTDNRKLLSEDTVAKTVADVKANNPLQVASASMLMTAIGNIKIKIGGNAKPQPEAGYTILWVDTEKVMGED